MSSGYLVVRTGKWRYGVPLTDVVEVAETVPVVAVPAAHRAVRGVMPFRQWHVPLIGLGALLGGEGLPAEPAESFVLTRSGDRRIALEVDDIDDLVREAPLPVPSGWQVPWAGAVARYCDELIPILDLGAVAERLAETEGGRS